MRSFRFISAVMMVVGLVLAVTSGMDQLIGDVNEKVSIWIVPHIFSNTFLRHFTELLYVICYRIFLILMRMNYITFQEWDEKVVYGENAIHDTIHVYVYNYFVCCMRTCICSQNQLYNGMGKVIHTMAYSTNLYSYNLMNLVSPSILMNYKPITAMETCFLMVWLVSVMVGCVMFAISIWFNRTVSIVVVLMLSLLGLSEGLFLPNAGCHFFRYLHGIEYQYTEKQYLWIGSIRNNMYM